LVILSLLAFEGGYTYFVSWAGNPNVAGAFNSNYVSLGYEIREFPDEIPKYIVVRAGGATVTQENPWGPDGSVQHVPVPAQTVMFLTDTYRPEEQREKNFHYLLPEDEDTIPAGAPVFYIN
jgi:hypothetical protein